MTTRLRITSLLPLLGLLWVSAGCGDAVEAAKAVGGAARAAKVVADQEVSVSAHSASLVEFEVPSDRKVRVEVQGTKDADKGFSAYVATKQNADLAASYANFSHMPAFAGEKVRSLAKTDDLPVGKWAVVVKNSENLMKGMVVKVKVTLDP